MSAHAVRQSIPTITVAIEFEVKSRAEGVSWHRWICTTCNPHRIGTWLASSEKVANNAALHAQWHREQENSK